MEDLAAKRRQVQREIRELELSLSQDTPGMDMDILSSDDENDSGSLMESSGEDSDEMFSLPPNVETCLQMNLVYQDVLEEKLTELERLLVENKEQQNEVMVQVSGPALQATTSGLPPLKVFLGSFMKPYFKDKVTGLGPPANPETRDKMNFGTRTYDEMKIRKWEGWQKSLLLSSIVSDSMKRLLQPKLFKSEYLSEKMRKAEDMEKQILQKQINQIEREIDDISSMSELQLMGSRHDDHDWEKISNIDFEGTRTAEDIRRFWENYLHPSVNKSSWKEEEIDKLRTIVENRNYCNWDKIAEELGTNRTAFMCLQTHQRYIHKGFKKSMWSKEEDQVFKELVEKMRIGNFIPYTQISYFMEGREPAQLVYRWTQVLDPSLRKGPWAKEEDEMLLKAVAKYGVRDWWKIRDEVPGRTDAQCRERYLDCLSEDVKKGRWSPEEEAMLINLVRKYGAGRWAKIASEMPNRIDCQCLQKWKMMTGYPCLGSKRIRKPPLKKRERKKKVVRIKKEEEVETSASSEEEVPYINSDEELTKEEPDLEIDVREEYILPSMEKWIPKECNLFPHLGLWSGQAARTNKTNKKASHSKAKATLGRPCSAKSFLVSHPGLRHTVLDRSGCPLSTSMGVAPPQIQEDQRCENDVIILSLSEVKNLLLWNGGSQKKQRCVLSKWTQKKNKKKSKKKGTVHSQGMVDPCEGQGSGSDPAPHAGTSTASHVCSADCTTLNDEILLTMAPWLGNLVLPNPCKEKECCKVDMVREKTNTVSLKSTPIFSLLLNLLSIDAKGCKKVIEARTKAEICVPHQQVSGTPPPKISHPSAPSHKRKLAQLLEDQQGLGCENKMEDQKKSNIIMMIPQPVVIAQPVLQGVVPAPDKPTTARGKSKTTQSQKRTRKPKAGQKLPEKSQNKEACSQNTCIMDGKKISQGPLTPQSPITFIVTPSGLLPVSGLGIPVAPQTPPEGMKSAPSHHSRYRRLKPKPTTSPNSLTLYINGAVGTESPSNFLQACPTVCVPAGFSAPSSGRTALSLPPTTSTSTDKHAGSVKCQNISISSLRSVTVPHYNSVCAQIPTNFLATKPASSVMPGPASVNAGRTVAGSTLTVSQGLPILQAGQPQTRQITANTSVKPVVTSTQPLSLSQQGSCRPKPNDLSVRPASKSALSEGPRPEHNVSIDPSLISPEEASHVVEWMKGSGGVKLPQLDVTLPYLPPFVSNLRALTTLLKCKAELKRCALSLLSSGGDGHREEASEEGIRALVAERLGSNPAYLLLKARFLSCFSFPAFLASVSPESPDPAMLSPFPCRESEENAFTAEDGDPQGGGMPKDGLLRADGRRAEAGEFSGITAGHHNEKTSSGLEL